MEAAKYLKNDGNVDKVVMLSVEGMLDECDARVGPKASEQMSEKKRRGKVRD